MVLSFCFACWRFYSVVLMDVKYSSSTFFLAHGVLLKNFKLDFMLGSLRKHWIGMRLPSSSQSYCSTRRVRIVSSVMPCKGSLDGSFMMFYLFTRRKALSSQTIVDDDACVRRTSSATKVRISFRRPLAQGYVASHLSSAGTVIMATVSPPPNSK